MTTYTDHLYNEIAALEETNDSLARRARDISLRVQRGDAWSLDGHDVRDLIAEVVSMYETIRENDKAIADLRRITRKMA